MTRRFLLLTAPLLAFARPLQAGRREERAIGTDDPPAARAGGVRVGVLGLFHPTELRVRAGGASALNLSAGTRTALLRGRDEARLRIEQPAIRIEHPGGALYAPSLRIAGATADARVVLEVPGRIVRTYRGTVEIAAAGGELSPIVRMGIETATASVTAAEQPDSTPLEALKAQAIAARSYFAATRGRHGAFDACDTTHCQFLREPPPDTHPAARAARATAGLLLSWHGAPVAALYSASCGGHTRSLADVGLAVARYPFFAVGCDYCSAHAPEWHVRLPLDAESERLEREHSEAARLAIVRRAGTAPVPGNHFETARDGRWLVVHGRGSGHGVGLCQAGAADLARRGAGFVEILQHYYPGTAIS
jgi:stage II sporulation protein D